MTVCDLLAASLTLPLWLVIGWRPWRNSRSKLPSPPTLHLNVVKHLLHTCHHILTHSKYQQVCWMLLQLDPTWSKRTNFLRVHLSSYGRASWICNHLDLRNPYQASATARASVSIAGKGPNPKSNSFKLHCVNTVNIHATHLHRSYRSNQKHSSHTATAGMSQPRWN